MVRASSMVWPQTNCSPSSRIARSTPSRIRGSPPRPISLVSAAERPASLVVPVSLPVTTRPQVAAFTNGDGLWPRCAAQSPGAILSRMSRSRVGASGMRSSASARHMSATPSVLDSEYSRIKASMPPPRDLPRIAVTSWRATLSASARVSPGSVATPINSAMQSGSGRRVASVMRARNALCGRTSAAKARNGDGVSSGSVADVVPTTLTDMAAPRSYGFASWQELGIAPRGGKAQAPLR